MNKGELLKAFESAYARKDPLFYVGKETVPATEMRIGDTVKVHQKIVEGNKERIQAFQGTLIKTQNTGLNKTVTVRKISFQVGVEKTFLLNSPRLEKIEILRRGVVRRSKLYYLRDRAGKQARIREKVVADKAAK